MSTLIRICIECGQPFHLLNWWQRLFTKWNSGMLCSRNCAEKFVDNVIDPLPIRPKRHLILIQGGKR
jgi:hypothetical protein